MSKEFFKKAAKFVNNTLHDMDFVAEGAKVVGANAAKNAKGLFRQINPDSANDIAEALIGRTMKAKPQAIIAAGALGYGVVHGGFKASNRSKMGYISAGTMANQVSEQHSPGIANDEQFKRNAERLRKSNKENLNTYGAEGDLVMALHNMR